MLEYFERAEGRGHFCTPLTFATSIGKFLYLFHVLPTKTCSTFVKFMYKGLVSLLLLMSILRDTSVAFGKIKKTIDRRVNRL